MANDKKITRADTVTMESFVLPRGDARNKDVQGEAVSAIYGIKSPDPIAAMVSPLVQRVNAMPTPHPAPTPKQIIASGGKIGRISIDDNPAAKGDAPWIENPDFQEVTPNEKHIAESAAKYGIDPDLLKSIIWVESTHGWYDRLTALFDANKSIRPANINIDYWGNAWGGREDLKDPVKNIAAGARMIKAISTAMPGASVASRATIYNKDTAAKVSDYGARVQKVYEEKPWIRWTPRAINARGSYRNGDRG